MADSHYAPNEIWAGSIGMSAEGAAATQEQFRPILRQGNTLLAGGPPLFQLAMILPTNASGALYFESSGEGMAAVRRLCLCQTGTLDDLVTTIQFAGSSHAYDGASYGGHRSQWADCPEFGNRIDWKLDYDAGVAASLLGISVSPWPWEAKTGALEALGYLHDDRAKPLAGVSRGVMQAMQNGLETVVGRPTFAAHVGYVPVVRIGKASRWLTPETPFWGSGKPLVLAARCISEMSDREIGLVVDGVEVATLTGLPAAWESGMRRTAPSVRLAPGLHTWAMYVRSLSANTDISTLSVYEVA